MPIQRSCPHRLLQLGMTLLFAGALCVTAHASVSAHPTAKDVPKLRLDYFVGQPALAQTLDPALVTNFLDADTIALTNANLVHILPNGKVAPDLATWQVSSNRLVYTFTIRRNARFANGHYVTAQDAAFSIERSLAPSTKSPGAAAYLGLLKGADAYTRGETKELSGVKVIGRRVLRITITKPAAYFLDALAYPTADVLDPTVVGGKPSGGTNDYLTNTCTGNQGAGPFTFVCRNTSSDKRSFYTSRNPMYVLAPSRYYYGRKATINIELPGINSADVAYRQYLGGRLDTTGIPLAFLNQWKGKSKEYHPFSSSLITYLTPNTHLAPFDNIHCRLAVAYAIDRDTIANRIDQGAQRPTYAVVPKGMLGYYDGRDNPHYNLSKARSELALCPGRTVPFELAYPTFGATVNEFVAMAGMLASVGMNVRPKPLPPNVWFTVLSQSLDQTNTQVVWNGFQQDYPDPQDYCALLLRSSQPYNIGGWHNARYDYLVDRADVEANRMTRAKLYIQAQHIALSQGAIVSLTDQVAQKLIKPYVHGLVGTEAYAQLVAKDLDWSNVSISKH